MRFGKAAIILTALATVPVFAAALLRPRPREAPEVKLVRLLRIEPQPPENLEIHYDSFFSEMPGFEPETWRAEFEIRGPAGSGICLTHGDIAEEILGWDSNWVAIAQSPTPASLRNWPFFGVKIGCRRVNLIVPSQTRSCRFTFEFRPLTAQERGMNLLYKSGLWRRFPGTSAWIWKQLPSTEHWLACRREVRLTLFPIEQEAHRLPLHPPMLGPQHLPRSPR